MDTSTERGVHNLKLEMPRDFPLWAFLSLVHTAHPRDLVPYSEGISLLYNWLAPIQSASEIIRKSYPPYMSVRNCQEVMQVIGLQYHCGIQYSALQNPHVNTANFFR